MSPLGGGRPRLNVFEYLRSDLEIHGGRANGLQKRGKIIHELARCDFLQKVVSAILYTSIRKLYHPSKALARSFSFGSRGRISRIIIR